MPHVDPTIRFWISFGVFVAVGISGGTVHLTHMIPADWIDAVTAWIAFFAFAGSGFVSLLNGMAMTNDSRIASAAVVPDATSKVAAIVAEQKP